MRAFWSVKYALGSEYLRSCFINKLKKNRFCDFRSQKIINPYRSRLNFWKTWFVPICSNPFWSKYLDLFRSVPIISNPLWYVMIGYDLTLHFALHCAVDFAISAWCYSSLLTWHDDPFKISHPWNRISGAAVSDLRWSAKHKQTSSQSINAFARIKSI